MSRMEVKIESLIVSVKGHEIVRDVSFSLKAHSTLCLVGESGSGKTTTALSLMGLLPKKARISNVWKGTLSRKKSPYTL